MAKKGTGRDGKGKQKAEKPDEFIRGLEFVRDLLNSVIPAVVSVGELDQAKATTNALIEMRNVELSQAQAGA